MANTNGTESFLGGREYYRSPLEAMREGPRERFLFVTCPVADGKSPDLLVTVDVDPESSRFCKIVSVLELGVGDEVHHTGWNACASSCCFNHNGSGGGESDSGAFPHSLTRSHLIVPCLHSSNIYAVDARNPRELKLDKKINGSELAEKFDMSFFHSVHCAPDGTVLVSCVGDGAGKNKGDFLVLDAATFEPRDRWPAGDERSVQFGYDFWYQSRQGVMVSTEWGVPNAIRHGFTPPAEVTSGVIPFAKLCLARLLGALTSAFDGSYGHAVNIWDWNQRRLVKSLTIEGPEGLIPFEVRFPHNPDRSDAFLCTNLGSSIVHLYREDPTDIASYKYRFAVTVPKKRVKGWELPEMPAMVTYVLISMDDRFLYCTCWLHGDVRQYDISNPFNVRLIGQCFVGGSIHTQSGIEVIDDPELDAQPEPVVFDDGRMVQGGPQMLQLSLDGRRLYVTTSLYSVWDRQFYPKLADEGSMMLQLDVDTEKGGLTLNRRFLVDFSREVQAATGAETEIPYLAHEMRYPGGDCTSDIWP